MKTIMKFFAAALVIVAAASCAKENAPEQKLVYKEFTASVDAVGGAASTTDGSRTTLNGKAVHWTAGDQILLMPSTDYKGTNLTVQSFEEDFAVFGGEVIDADAYRAIYPAAAYYQNWSYDYVSVFSNGSSALATQYAVDNDFSIAGSFNTSSNFAVSTSSKDGHLYFQNINAYLKFSLDIDDAYSVEVSSASVTNSSTGTTSSSCDLGGTLNYRTSEHTVYITSNSIITFKYKDSSVLKKGVNYYIAIPAVEIEGLNFVVKDASGNELINFTKASTLKAESNVIYNLGTMMVPKKYKAVSQVSRSSDLVDGGLYVITLQRDQTSFWTTRSDSKLVLTSGFNENAYSNEFAAENVFVYGLLEGMTPGVTVNPTNSYAYAAVSTWKSLSNDKYLTTSLWFGGTENLAGYFTNASSWANSSAKDIDIYVYNSIGCDRFFYANYSSEVLTGLAGTAESYGGQPGRKWYIYKVQEVE